MPRQETRTLYTLAELKERFPDAYKKVLARWEDLCDRSGDIPWVDETMASLKAVVAACGATLRDWSIGCYSYSSIKVEVEDEDDEGNTKDAAWLIREVLRPNGYVNEKGEADFPGLCKWTGYCADDAMIEAVYKGMLAGETLTKALGRMADVAREYMESDADAQRSEDSMDANWSDNEYTEGGDDA